MGMHLAPWQCHPHCTPVWAGQPSPCRRVAWHRSIVLFWTHRPSLAKAFKGDIARGRTAAPVSQPLAPDVLNMSGTAPKAAARGSGHQGAEAMTWACVAPFGGDTPILIHFGSASDLRFASRWPWIWGVPLSSFFSAGSGRQWVASPVDARQGPCSGPWPLMS